MSPVSGFALRAALISIVALIFVASSADREGAFIAGHEKLPPNRIPAAAAANGAAAITKSTADVITADSAKVAIQMICRCCSLRGGMKA